MGTLLQVSGDRGLALPHEIRGRQEHCHGDVPAGAKNGLELISFTEHVRNNLSYDFGRLVKDVKAARKNFPGMKILVGCETKVIDSKGDLDASEETLGNCDVVLATFHSFPSLNEGDKSRLPSTSEKKELESGLRKMLENPVVDIWTHPITFFQRGPLCEKDIREIIRLCIRNSVLIEDNIRPRYRSPRLIEMCRKMGAVIVTGSDAHGAEDLLSLKRE
jgi:putative hydrolase